MHPELFRELRRETNLAAPLVEVESLLRLARFLEQSSGAVTEPRDLELLRRRPIVAPAAFELCHLSLQTIARLREVPPALVRLRGAYEVPRPLVDLGRLAVLSRLEVLGGGLERSARFHVGLRGLLAFSELSIELRRAELFVRQEKPFGRDFFMTEPQAELTREVVLLRLLVALERLVPLGELLVVEPGVEEVSRLLRRHRFLAGPQAGHGIGNESRHPAKPGEDAELAVHRERRPQENDGADEKLQVLPVEGTREPAQVAAHDFEEIGHRGYSSRSPRGTLLR